MTDPVLGGYVEHELKYQARKVIAKGIRDHCGDSDPMVTGITVALGTIMAMAVFTAILRGNGRGVRGR